MNWYKVAILVWVLGAVCWVYGIAHYLLVNWEMDRNIMSWKDRAQVSSNAGDMYDYLIKMRDGLDSYEMTEGHYALIFKTPWNEISRDYQAVNRTLERLEIIREMNQASIEYQTGMDDVRGTLRELSLDPTAWWYLHHATAEYVWILFGWIFLIGWGLIIVIWSGEV